MGSARSRLLHILVAAVAFAGLATGTGTAAARPIHSPRVTPKQACACVQVFIGCDSNGFLTSYHGNGNTLPRNTSIDVYFVLVDYNGVRGGPYGETTLTTSSTGTFSTPVHFPYQPNILWVGASMTATNKYTTDVRTCNGPAATPKLHTHARAG